MPRLSRRIGPIGTTTRLVGAAALLYLALLDGASWGLTRYDAVFGFVVVPAAMLALGLAALRYATGSVRFTGPAGIVLNCAVIVALLVNPYTAGGAELFYGATRWWPCGGDSQAARAQSSRTGSSVATTDRMPDLLPDRRGRGSAGCNRARAIAGSNGRASR